MTSPPTFRYFVGGAEMPVYPGSSLWNSPLPTNRHHFQRDNTCGVDQGALTHGDYFTAAHCFLEREHAAMISAAFNPEPPDRISDIHICLMKHGELYHPARVRAASPERQRSFVLNVAVSEPGRRVIDSEVTALKKLGELSGPSCVPKVYGKGSVVIDGDRTAEMFLGEWFEGYHEFHLSDSPSGGLQTLSVWGENDTPDFLSSPEAYLLYHQAAKILTRYYNITTTEHISHWHHAGGDFVIKRESNRLMVKLITARQYSPLLRMDETIHDPRQKRDRAMAALLLFFLTLSIRMRLDRLDGIGDVAWADDTAVAGTWTGFLEGLANSNFPSPFHPITQFESYLSTYSTTGLCDLAKTLIPALPISSAEKLVVGTHIGGHMEVLCDTIRRIGFA